MSTHRLGLLLAAPLSEAVAAQIGSLSGETLRRGGRVYLYLVDDGVTAVGNDELQRLRADGVNLFCCALGARRRNVPWDEKATFGGLTILADMLENCDAFAAFTPRGITTTNYETRRNEKRVLISVQSDPRVSHLPAEALRIAAGLQPWMDARIDVLLEGAGARVLLPEAGEAVDGRDLAEHLRMVLDWKRPVFLGPDAAPARGVSRSDKRWKVLNPRGLRLLQGFARNILRF